MRRAAPMIRSRAAGDLSCRTPPLTVKSPLCGRAIARPLEHDGDPAIVLRHHGRMPSAAASLVEQVRQRVLVITRMASESQHHGLVFFPSREVTSFRRMDTTPAIAKLHIVSPPLVQHKLTLLRDRSTPTKIFT